MLISGDKRREAITTYVKSREKGSGASLPVASGSSTEYGGDYVAYIDCMADGLSDVNAMAELVSKKFEEPPIKKKSSVASSYRPSMPVSVTTQIYDVAGYSNYVEHLVGKYDRGVRIFTILERRLGGPDVGGASYEKVSPDLVEVVKLGLQEVLSRAGRPGPCASGRDSIAKVYSRL
jgi:hypothetical protein